VPRLRISLLFGCLLALAAPLSHGAVSAQAGTVSLEDGAISMEITRSSVRLERSAAIEIKSTAEAAGSRLGRIPRCDQRLRDVRPPLNKREKKKLDRLFDCLDTQVRRADQVVNAFLRAVVTSDGPLACLLLTPEERLRLGGGGCAPRIDAAAPGFAARDPFIQGAVIAIGNKESEAAYIVALANPPDKVLLELGVVNNHWRISDTNNFFP
jgi:hypothetical protein